MKQHEKSLLFFSGKTFNASLALKIYSKLNQIISLKSSLIFFVSKRIEVIIVVQLMVLKRSHTHTN